MENRQQWLVSRFNSVIAGIPEHVKLVAVSKHFPVQDIKVIYEQGQRQFGENYAQELIEKAAHLPPDIEWHFIGGLQSNKIAMLLKCPSLHTIQTVDSISKAEEIEKQCAKIGRQVNIFIQVNASLEKGKHGLHPSLVEGACLHILSNMKRCVLVGLMMIGSVKQSLSENENYEFVLMKNLQKDIELSSGKRLMLSMGMTMDYEKAIEQGSDLVRIGSAIFGSRVHEFLEENNTSLQDTEKISLV